MDFGLKDGKKSAHYNPEFAITRFDPLLNLYVLSDSVFKGYFLGTVLFIMRFPHGVRFNCSVLLINWSFRRFEEEVLAKLNKKPFYQNKNCIFCAK
jgi:hypothetical protein